MEEQEQVFMRIDLNKAGRGGTAYYRLDNGMNDFLNKILEKHGDIEAIILTKKENGVNPITLAKEYRYGFNIGFSLPEKAD